jgi:hypothetical protein
MHVLSLPLKLLYRRSGLLKAKPPGLCTLNIRPVIAQGEVETGKSLFEFPHCAKSRPEVPPGR